MKNLIFGETNQKILIFLEGSGGASRGTKDFLLNLSEKSSRKVIYSASYLDPNLEAKPQIQQSDWLKETVKSIRDRSKDTSIDLVATSMGAFAAVKFITEADNSYIVDKLILLDPADYYLDLSNAEVSWSGGEEYRPTKPVAADLLKTLDSSAVVDVIRFSIRNCKDNEYLPERGIDNENGDPRLNEEMIKAFYKNLPKKNKGRYIGLADVPHAFARDGDIEKNSSKLVALLAGLIG